MAVVNITVSNDADFHRLFQYQTDEGVPINLTGGAMHMMLRRNAKDETAVMRLGTDTGEIVLTNAALGQFSVMIVQDELQRLALGEYDHSLILTWADGQKRGVWYGKFTNNPGPSR